MPTGCRRRWVIVKAFGANRDWLGSQPEAIPCSIRESKKGSPVVQDSTEVVVAPDSYQVSPEPILMIADLYGTMALCLHDEGRAIGGMLHLTFIGDTGMPSDVTDNTLSSVLVVLDRFKRAVIGNSCRRDDIQARILAHALPPTNAREPTATLVDLIRADLADSKVACGTQITRRTHPMRVCFQPVQGRVWIARTDRKAG